MRASGAGDVAGWLCHSGAPEGCVTAKSARPNWETKDSNQDHMKKDERHQKGKYKWPKIYKDISIEVTPVSVDYPVYSYDILVIIYT